uniref:Uncharacterized protein n=1 Tax=Anopheles atroparvus TaxID=41427 RepID=A0AAG5DJP8_ANOAO
MFRHCQNLQRLAIDRCLFSIHTVDQINSLKGLKELSLCHYLNRFYFSNDRP